MPSYETSQSLIAFIRRLPSEFPGFTPSGQLLSGSFIFKNQKIDIRVFTRTEKVDSFVLSVPLFALPKTGLDELFRQLLAWNNGASDAIRFGVDDRANRIYLVCMRPAAGFAYEEFLHCVDRMVQVAAEARTRLKQNFGLTQ